MKKLKIIAVLILLSIIYTIYKNISYWIVTERKAYILKQKTKIPIQNTIENTIENEIEHVGILDNRIKNVVIYAFQAFITLLLVSFVFLT